MSKKSPLEIADFQGKDSFRNGDWWFQWCCDCGLRHIWNFEITRGKTPDMDTVTFRGVNDEWATAARKHIAKSKIKRGLIGRAKKGKK